MRMINWILKQVFFALCTHHSDFQQFPVLDLSLAATCSADRMGTTVWMRRSFADWRDEASRFDRHILKGVAAVDFPADILSFEAG